MYRCLLGARGASFALAAALLAPAALAQRTDAALAASAIDPALRASNPPAIVRVYEHRFDVESAGRATETVRRVVTVFNEAGRDAAKDAIYHDRFRRLDEVRATLYDATGKVVRDIRGNEMPDMAASDGFSLYADHRVRYVDAQEGRYPYTLEIAYRVKHDGLLQWPTWFSQPSGLPTERSSFRLSVPEALAPRIRAQGTVPEPAVGQARGRQTYAWQAAALPAFTPEPFGPSWTRQAPAVYLAPPVFEIADVQGSMASWEAFGRFYGGLSAGRQALPAAAKADVARVVDGAASDREKVARLYRYMQERTRYVSIQLGIGGWQPFDAAYVHTRSYGDCKALVNYLQALLGEAGIPSVPALVKAGAGATPIFADFPSNQFNHVILAVPLAQDTVWLEATSQTAPFNHLGSFTEDRHVLLVTPEGGRLARTPASPASANRQHLSTRLSLASDGTASGRVALVFTGNQQDRVRDGLVHASGQDRAEWLHRRFEGASVALDAPDFSALDRPGDTLRVASGVRIPRFATPTGRRLFVPVVLERWRTVPPPPTGARTQPVEAFPYAFEDTDSLIVAVPAGYRAEALPPPVDLTTPFGAYRLHVTFEGQTLRVVRRLVAAQASLAAAEYDALRAFLHRVAASDNARVVLVRE